LDLIPKFFPNFRPKNPFFLLKLCPSLFFGPKKSFFLILVNFWPLNSIFFRIFAQKRPFFVLKLSLFLSPEKSFFPLKLVNFWTLFSNVFAIFGPKNSFFMLKLSPRLFFWPEKSFHFFFENLSIFGLYTQFFPRWKGGILGVLLLFFNFWGYLAKFWPVFGTFLLHVKKWTCFIPLGIILFFNPLGIFFLIPLGIRLYFCQTLTQNGLEIIVLGPFWEIFQTNFWTIVWLLVLIFGNNTFLFPWE